MSDQFRQLRPLDKRLAEEAQRLRKQVQGTPPGVERDKLIRLARQAEMGGRINEWINSPGPRRPT
jgi:hypothetical protein